MKSPHLDGPLASRAGAPGRVFSEAKLVARLACSLALSCGLFLIAGHAAFGQGESVPVATPPPMMPDAGAQPALSHLDLDNYKLTAGDSITILVYGEDDMTTRAHITKDGTVTIPLIGQIKIAGDTTREASDRIREALVHGQFYVNPRVSIILEAPSQNSYIMFGQIAKPGTFSFSSQESVDLVQAIANAGGLTRIANARDVTIIRKENGVPKTYHVDAKKMMTHSDATPFYVKSGDVITIGETFF